jgi:predicted transcriptional regulator YheO
MNYRIQLNDREIQSSTIWIRDTDGSTIGAVCVNMDYSNLIEAVKSIEKSISSARHTSDRLVKDTFARDVDELIEQSVNRFLDDEGLPGIEAMTTDNKVRLIRMLESRGLFQIRFSVQKVADLLNVSRASIYNYREEAASFQYIND